VRRVGGHTFFSTRTVGLAVFARMNTLDRFSVNAKIAQFCLFEAHFEMTMRSLSPSGVSLHLFTRSARRNLRSYPKCFQFWWPIMDARVARNEVSAEDLLLNPIFRWGLSRSSRQAGGV
jgi:hypothetical protein